MHILLLEDLAPDAKQWLASRHSVDYLPALAVDPAAFGERLAQVDALGQELAALGITVEDSPQGARWKK